MQISLYMRRIKNFINLKNFCKYFLASLIRNRQIFPVHARNCIILSSSAHVARKISTHHANINSATNTRARAATVKLSPDWTIGLLSRS